jgi:hypothetical protein
LEVGNKSLELGTIKNITNKNFNYEEIKILNSGMPVTIPSRIFLLPVCYKKNKLKIYLTLILRVVLYGCETWSVTNQEKLDGRGMWHVWGREDVHTGVWYGNVKERDNLGNKRK